MRIYQNYKESGYEWIGTIPSDWSTKPIKHIVDLINGEAFKPADWCNNGIPIIRIQNLNGGSEYNYYSGNVEGKYHVHCGDLLYGWSGNRGTSFGPFNWSGVGLHYLNQHIFKVLEKDCNRSWLYWCLKAVTSYVEEQAHGIIGMVHVTKGDLGSISIPLPGDSEQIAIAAFLDKETSKIDTLVAEQERLIALLQEKRQAVISRSVTKGLNPEVSMKNSGVEWLGEVPVHWEVQSLKRLVQAPLSYGANEAATDTAPENPRYVRITDIDADGSLRDETFRSLPFDIARSYLLSDGDILLARSGATVGKSFQYKNSWGVCCFAGYLIKASFCKYKMSSDYACLFFASDSYWASINSERIQATIPNVSAERYGAIPMTCPPIKEQILIVVSLVKHNKKVDELINEAVTGILLLRELRSALISAAITGKIDVRDYNLEVPAAA